MEEFNIGDIVTWYLHIDNGTPNRYEIIGTREQPFDGRNANPFNELINVNPGNDFLLRHLSADNVFRPFQHARRVDLQKIEE